MNRLLPPGSIIAFNPDTLRHLKFSFVPTFIFVAFDHGNSDVALHNGEIVTNMQIARRLCWRSDEIMWEPS